MKKYFKLFLDSTPCDGCSLIVSFAISSNGFSNYSYMKDQDVAKEFKKDFPQYDLEDIWEHEWEIFNGEGTPDLEEVKQTLLAHNWKEGNWERPSEQKQHWQKI